MICWAIALALVVVSALADPTLLDKVKNDMEIRSYPMRPEVQPFYQPSTRLVDQRFVDDNVKYSDVVHLLTSWKSEDNIKHIVACEHSQYSLASCPVGETIYVRDGFFGRDDTTTCPRFGQLVQSRRCSSPLSLWKLKQSCNYKNTCVLRPHTSIFGDPCIGTPKYIKMTYYCLPRISAKFMQHMKTVSPKLFPKIDVILSQRLKELLNVDNISPKFVFPTEQSVGQLPLIQGAIREVVVCENFQNTLARCPEGHIISVQDGFFGRDDLTTCPRFDQPIQTNQCFAPLSLWKLKQFCNFKNTCLLQPLTSIFGDPCIGTPKYIKMTYKCLNTQQIWRTQDKEKLITLIGRDKLWKDVNEVLDTRQGENKIFLNNLMAEFLESWIPMHQKMERQWISENQVGLMDADQYEDKVFLNKLIQQFVRQQVLAQLEEPAQTKEVGQERLFLKKQLLNLLLRSEVPTQYKGIEQAVLSSEDIQTESWRNPMTSEVRKRHFIKKDINRQFPIVTEEKDSPNEIVVCGNDTFTLKCPVNHIIKVVNGFFGRTDIATCQHDDIVSPPVTCVNPISLAVLKSRCHKYNSCLLKASQSMFGYHCMNTRSYIKMTYKCLNIQQILRTEDKEKLITLIGRDKLWKDVNEVLDTRQGENKVFLNNLMAEFLESWLPMHQKMERQWISENQVGLMDTDQYEDKVFLNKLIQEFVRQQVLTQLEEPAQTREVEQERLFLKKQLLNLLLRSEVPTQYKGIEQAVLSAEDSQTESWRNPMTSEVRKRHFIKQDINRQFPIVTEEKDSPNEIVVCGNDTFTLKCPVNHIIKVVNGFFGRTDIATCQHDDIVSPPVTCVSPISLAVLKSRCHNYNSCLLKASQSMFGYHCMNTRSYIKMTYKCLPMRSLINIM